MVALFFSLLASLIAASLVDYLVGRLLPANPRLKHIIAILAATAVFVIVILLSENSAVSKSQVIYDYQVWVKNSSTGSDVPNAEVTLVVGSVPPMTETTDGNGIARFRIESSYGNVGRLVVEANGYDRLEQHVNINEGASTDIVSLKPLQ